MQDLYPEHAQVANCSFHPAKSSAQAVNLAPSELDYLQGHPMTRGYILSTHSLHGQEMPHCSNRIVLPRQCCPSAVSTIQTASKPFEIPLRRRGRRFERVVKCSCFTMGTERAGLCQAVPPSGHALLEVAANPQGVHPQSPSLPNLGWLFRATRVAS